MIYLDYNATTPLSENVKQVIIDNLNLFYNPSSMYKESNFAKEKINDARIYVSELINANDKQIIFTGCATESNNAVFNTCVNNSSKKNKNIIVSCVEHSAVLEAAKYYKKYRNVDVVFIPVDNKGRINILDIQKAINENTILVSIMLVNNEIGNIYPIKEIAEAVHQLNPSTYVHTDATQAIGKMNVDVQNLSVDFLTMSGHKFNAPKGIGALYIKRIDEYVPFLVGGHQEKNYRAGTENLLSIIALGQAAKDLLNFNEYDSIRRKRDFFERKVLSYIPGTKVLGDIDNRVCNTSCILFDQLNGIDICELVNSMDDICISSGSACNSIILEPSHVMKALGYNRIPIRVSIGKNTTDEELTKCFQSLIKTTKLLRKKEK